MKSAGWVVSFLFFLPGLARAESNCSPVQLDEKRLGPVQSQTNAQFCYAFATADLLSWEIGERVSGADVALVYNDRVHERMKYGFYHSQLAFRADPENRLLRNRSGGYPDEAFRAIQEKGACLEKDLPSELYLFGPGSKSEEIYLASMLSGLETIKKSWDSDQDSRYVCKNLPGVQEIFPWIRDSDLFEILQGSAALEFVSKLQARNCDGRRRKLPVGIRAEKSVGVGRTATERSASLLSKLDEVLGRGRPVALGVSADFLGLSKEEGFHAVTVSARRLNPATGRCEYKIRDSNRPLACDSRLYTCDRDGSHWAPEALLLKTLDSVYFVR